MTTPADSLLINAIASLYRVMEHDYSPGLRDVYELALVVRETRERLARIERQLGIVETVNEEDVNHEDEP